MKLRILIATVLTVTAAAWTGSASGSRTDMVVHEWGTFLGMNGSDGVSLDGMYHEEHALPGLRPRPQQDQLKLRSALVKGETPVIYFYATAPQQVSVRGRLPRRHLDAVVSPGDSRRTGARADRLARAAAQRPHQLVRRRRAAGAHARRAAGDDR